MYSLQYMSFHSFQNSNMEMVKTCSTLVSDVGHGVKCFLVLCRWRPLTLTTALNIYILLTLYCAPLTLIYTVSNWWLSRIYILEVLVYCPVHCIVYAAWRWGGRGNVLMTVNIWEAFQFRRVILVLFIIMCHANH